MCPAFELADDSGPVSVLELPLRPGDFFLFGDTVFVIENDFATLDVPAPFAGRVVQVLAKVGDKATINTPVLEIEPMTTFSERTSTRTAERKMQRPSLVTMPCSWFTGITT
ncbi:hypothetical protein D9M68_867730 [compost metagenome]